MGDRGHGVRVAVHPAHEDVELGQKPLALVGKAGRRTQGESDGHPEARSGLPERPERTVVPGSRGGPGPIGVLGNELDHVQAVHPDGPIQVPDDPVRSAPDGGLIDRRHRIEPSGVATHAVGQVGRIQSERTVHVHQRDIDARVVHLADAAAGPKRRVMQVGRVELFGVVFAVERPGQPMVRPIDPEIDARGRAERLLRRGIQETASV